LVTQVGGTYEQRRAQVQVSLKQPEEQYKLIVTEYTIVHNVHVICEHDMNDF